jgi:hypothetical protein
MKAVHLSREITPPAADAQHAALLAPSDFDAARYPILARHWFGSVAAVERRAA